MNAFDISRGAFEVALTIWQRDYFSVTTGAAANAV
jgi:hypothetical protein